MEKININKIEEKIDEIKKNKIKEKEKLKNIYNLNQESFEKISKILNTIYFWDYNLPSYKIFKWMKYIIDNYDEKTIYKLDFLKAIQKLIIYTTINNFYDKYDSNQMEEIIDKTFKTENFNQVLSYFQKKEITKEDIINTNFTNKNNINEKLMMYFVNVWYGDRNIYRGNEDYIINYENIHFIIHPKYYHGRDQQTIQLLNSFANVSRYEHHIKSNPFIYFRKNFRVFEGWYLNNCLINPNDFKKIRGKNYIKNILLKRADKIVENINKYFFN